MATLTEDGQDQDMAVSELSWMQARRAARECARPGAIVESSLEDAIGAVLAEPLQALTALPPFDVSAMDGFAVAGPGPWLVVGDVRAGSIADRVADGTAVRIATGAAMPMGTDAVLRREHSLISHDSDGERLFVGDASTGRTAPHPGFVEFGADIRPRGQECAAGEPLLEPGGVVTPAVVGMAAAAGFDLLRVVRPPSVALLILGDELLQRGVARDGRIRDALGPMLPGWISWAGGRSFPPQHLPDTIDNLVAALDDANADVIVTTGSTAAGPADHLHAALNFLGARWHVDGVHVRPGHPMCLATLPDGRHVVGLPGNPLAAISAVLTLLVPLLATLRGEHGAEEAHVLEAVLTVDVRPHPDSTRLLPIRSGFSGPEITATPTMHVGPAMLRGLSLADGIAVIPPGGGEIGSFVKVLPLP
ncbi:MAG: molybdopterin molybdotransferase MoeA [Actinomycetes bacterium]